MVRPSRVEAICDRAVDLRALRLDLLAEMRRAVPFTWYAWTLTDPDTGVGWAPLADVPCLPELPTLIRLKYQTSVNRWTDMTTPVALLSDVGDPSRSAVWRQVQSRFAVVDVASVVFRDQFGVWSFLDLWRDQRGGRFGPADVDHLTELTAPVTAAVRRCLAGTFTEPVDAPAQPGGPVVLLLDPDLNVRAQTADTERYLRLLVPPDEGRSPVPAGAYNVAAQLLAAEVGVNHAPARARVHVTGGGWLTLRAARIADHDTSQPQDIAVTIEKCGPRGAGRPVRPSPRPDPPGVRCAGTARRRRRHPECGTRTAGLRVHPPGPPEGDLRQDRAPGPTKPARRLPRQLTRSPHASPEWGQRTTRHPSREGYP